RGDRSSSIASGRGERGLVEHWKVALAGGLRRAREDGVAAALLLRLEELGAERVLVRADDAHSDLFPDEAGARRILEVDDLAAHGAPGIRLGGAGATRHLAEALDEDGLLGADQRLEVDGELGIARREEPR